jgi:hypothetical protein
LIKDLLTKIPSINEVWEKATLIVNSLRNAPKQYAYLRLYQEGAYGVQKALIAARFTRWGTQYRLLKAVEDSKLALRQLALADETGFLHGDIVLDSQFWVQLLDLLDVLEPIHKLQVMSEDNRATLNYVFERWTAIQSKLLTIARSNNCFAKDIEAFIAHEQGKLWKARLDRQLTSLHTAAYFLQPQAFDTPMTEKVSGTDS